MGGRMGKSLWSLPGGWCATGVPKQSMTWSPTMYRALTYVLCFLVLILVSAQAEAAGSGMVTNEPRFQNGEAFSVRKAMNSIYGNVDKQNRSTYMSASDVRDYGHGTHSFSFSTVKWKAFELNNVETVFLITSGVPVNLKGERVCPSCLPFLGLHVFEKNGDVWKLSASTNTSTAERYEDITIDFVKIGKDLVAFAINDGAVVADQDSIEWTSSRWTALYAPVDGKLKKILSEMVYNDNTGGCSTEGGAGKVYTEYADIKYLDEPDLVALANTCHRFKTDIYVFPSDSKFYALKTITTDTLEWKGPDGKRLPPNRLEWNFQFFKGQYVRDIPIQTTGPMVPLFDEDSDYQIRRQSLEKIPSGTARVK